MHYFPDYRITHLAEIRRRHNVSKHTDLLHVLRSSLFVACASGSSDDGGGGIKGHEPHLTTQDYDWRRC